MKRKKAQKRKTSKAAPTTRRVRLQGVVMPVWEYKSGFVMWTQYHRLYRDNKLGVQLEVITRRSAVTGRPTSKGKTYFFIDGDKREFATQDEMLAALNAKRHNAVLSGAAPQQPKRHADEPHPPRTRG